MDRTDVAYVINTTPKYFYLLPLHIGLIYRYAPLLKWDIWIATEKPDHPIIEAMRNKYGVKIMVLEEKESGFLASRAATFRGFSYGYEFIIPVQEDFLLERFPDFTAIEDSMEMMECDTSIQSIRWMPCPDPHVDDVMYSEGWKILDAGRDDYLFTFQLCIWRPTPLVQWYTRLCLQFDIDNPGPLTKEERLVLEIRENYAENRQGQRYFHLWHMSGGERHLAWMRVHKHPNAVYMSPWPYRPTAVVGGRIEEWAIELGKREGFPLV